MRFKSIKDNKGLTLVELVFVISIIGILSAILVGVIDPQRQRDYAEDSAIRANMNKACAGIEAYYQGENEVYPEEGAANNPLHASAGTSTVAVFYIAEWPTGFVYNRNVAGDDFSIHAQQAGNTNYYKCNSAWKNVRECGVGTDLGDMQACDPT